MLAELDHALARSWFYPGLAGGVLFTVGTWGLLTFAAQFGAGAKEWQERFFDRGIIPVFELFCFWLGTTLLTVRLPLLAAERRELESWRRRLSPGPDIGTLRAELAGDAAALARGRVHPWRRRLVRQFIRQVVMRHTAGGDNVQADATVEAIAESERRKLDVSHTFVRYLIWVIPTLGFVGTVLGISLAVSQFGAVATANSGLNELQENMVTICRELGAGFTTTFWALLFSAVLALEMAIIDRQEMSLLGDLQDLCTAALQPAMARAVPGSPDHPATAAASPRPPPFQRTGASPPFAAASAGFPAPVVINLSTRDTGPVDVALVAREAVIDAVCRLADSAADTARTLADPSSALRLRQFVEANMVQMDAMREWASTSAVRREDIDGLSRAISEHTRVAAALVAELVEHKQVQREALDRMTGVAELLHRDGVRANLVVQSMVIPA